MATDPVNCHHDLYLISDELMKLHEFCGIFVDVNEGETTESNKVCQSLGDRR